jgi:hypothetical protein
MSVWKRRSATAAVVVILAAAPAARAREQPPSFADHPGGAVFKGHNAAPVLATREARQFRTMVREGARRQPNFDGHYIVSTWGCGADCETGAIIDAISGKVIPLPVVTGSPEDAKPEASHFDYRLDSRLLVMNGMIGEEPPMGAHYFTFDGSRLTPIKTIVKPEKHWDPPAGETPQ